MKPTPARFLASACALLVAALTGAPAGLAEPVREPPLEGEVKAAFVYNFAKFVEWPAGAFAAPDSPLTICAIAGDLLASQLERAVAGKKAGGRGVHFRRLPDDDPLEGCHLLVLEPADTATMRAALSRVRQRPVLTVGHHRDFISAGGVIEFMRQGERMRFRINVDAASRAGLSISSKLLTVADVVHDTHPPEGRK